MNMTFALIVFVFCILFAAFMVYRDTLDQKQQTTADVEDNMPIYHKLKATVHILTGVAIVFAVATAILYLIGVTSGAVYALLLSSIIFIINGNIVMHYHLLRRGEEAK
ncbi:hypothetical protein ABTQ33_02195 [Paucilactobacillus suebicus]|uniref:Uncharacterized protein n=1 Tax=Paucilactobacillus suebicus DSM 5007 = KCTC 3549 TaxID=1423807 RepID=A0A0R1W388_9LACO|nr:hypothetical protein [Paucilactobacillus suebicus]KRM12122.1 hypothetical protein FD16_GL000197 [Paucilactobacillus suebicus DSM 5007 = KCTC 3549]